MVLNYSKGQPLGNNNVPQYNAPAPVPALARNGSTNQASSSVITLTQDTTAVEVAVQGTGGAVIKWIQSTDTGASVFGISSVGATDAPNFDHAVTANSVRRFVLPIDTTLGAPSSYGSVQGANRANNLYQRIAIVSGGKECEVEQHATRSMLIFEQIRDREHNA